MGLLYDILRGNVDCEDIIAGIAYCAPRRRTRYTPLLYVPNKTTNYAKNSVLSRIAYIYNKMFRNTDPFSHSKPVFKKQIYSDIVGNR